MGFKLTKDLANGIKVEDAYGRMETVSGRKDGNIEASFSWWKDQDASDARTQTVDEDSFTITGEELIGNADLLKAYDAFVSELYKHAKAVKFPDAADVIE